MMKSSARSRSCPASAIATSDENLTKKKRCPGSFVHVHGLSMCSPRPQFDESSCEILNHFLPLPDEAMRRPLKDDGFESDSIIKSDGASKSRESGQARKLGLFTKASKMTKQTDLQDLPAKEQKPYSRSMSREGQLL